MLVRTRGGARPTTLKSILQREQLNVEVKTRIAAAAAAKVRDEDAVMLEAGTTCALVARHFSTRRGIQLVTNSVLVFNNARINPNLSVILTGGVFRRESESFVGPLAERAIGEFNARIAFLGTDGFSPERGLTTRFVEGAQVASTMRNRAEETWLVADSGLPAGAAEALQEHTQLCVV